MTMTDTEAKALALVNEVRDDRGYHPLLESFSRKSAETEALCRAIEREAATEARHATELREQAERFREAVDAYGRLWSKRTPSRDEYNTHFAPFILPAPDPLVEVIKDLSWDETTAAEEWAEDLRAAMQARGYEWRKIGEAGE